MPTGTCLPRAGPQLRRDAQVSITGQRVYLEACGGVPAGMVIEEIFDRLSRRVPKQTGTPGRPPWGERMNPSLLDRSAAQRRFDALLAISKRPPDRSIGRVEPLVNIVVDQARSSPTWPARRRSDPAPADPATVVDRRCETTSGINRPRRHARRRPGVMSAGRVRHRRCRDRPGAPSAPVHRWFPGGGAVSVDRWCLWPGCACRPGAAKPTTPNPGAATDQPARTTPDPPAPATTAGNNNTTTKPGATHRKLAHLPTRRHRNRPLNNQPKRNQIRQHEFSST